MLTINEIVSLCEEYRKVSGRKHLWTNVYTFINFCLRHGAYFQQNIVDEWCTRRDAEANNSFYNTSENPLFVNPTLGDYRIRDGVDFPDIEFEKIGRY